MNIKKIRIKEKSSVFTILKGALNALIVSLVAILIFAFIIKLTDISDGLIKPINQIIKVISILVGCFSALKSVENKTVFKGILIGVFYTVLAFLLFSALNGKFEFSLTIFLDVLFGAVVGLISTIICNIFRKR